MPDRTTSSLPDLLQTVLPPLIAGAAGQGFRLTFSLDIALETGPVADPDRVRRTVRLLVANALTTLPPGDLDLRAALREDREKGMQLHLRVASPGTEFPGSAFDPCSVVVPLDPRPQQAAPTRRVLVVDDHQINRLLVRRMLEQRGFQIVEVENGKLALERLAGETFDLVLMDLQMPEMGGLEATSRIRERERGTGRHVPIIALTAHALTTDRQRCLDAGMDDYLSKPVRVNDLVAAVERGLTVATAPVPAPAPVAAAKGGAIDWDDLKRRLGPDLTLVAEVLPLFGDDWVQREPALDRAVAARDAAEIRRLAHLLKGSLASIGAVRASGAARDLEELAGAPALAGLPACVARLKGEIDDLLAEIAQVVRQDSSLSGEGERSHACSRCG